MGRLTATEGIVVTLIGSSRVLEPEYLRRLDGAGSWPCSASTGSIWWCCRTGDGWTLTEGRPDERKSGGRTRRTPVPAPPVPVRRRRSA
jgi:hypothetical protein